LLSILVGSIAFGARDVPVKVYSAHPQLPTTSSLPGRGNQLSRKDNGRIRYKRRFARCGCEVVAYSRDLTLAYEFLPTTPDGESITDDDSATLPEERIREIEVLEFAPGQRGRRR